MDKRKSIAFSAIAPLLKLVPCSFPAIINYHRLGSQADCRESAVECTPTSLFTQHMDYLVQEDYRFASLDELVRHVKGEIRLPAKTIAVTFDDGFHDNFKNAFPVLKERNIKATIFLTTGFIGKTLTYKEAFWQPFCNENRNNLFRFLSWEEIEIMKGQGIEFQPHTHTHVNLTTVSRLQAEEEIGISKEIIEKRLGEKAKHFAYPYGLYNNQTIQMVQKAGFDAAWTVAGDNLVRGMPLYRLPRRGDAGGSPLNRFRLVLSPVYSLFIMLKGYRANHY